MDKNSIMTKSVITIGRQFGSGGREIGEKLAKELNIPYYDKEIISIPAQKSGISPVVLSDVDEKAANSLLYSLAMATNVYGRSATPYYDIPLNDKLFVLQSEVIKNFAQEGSCVIVGRCADYILKEYPFCLNIFIHSALSKRIQRAVENYGIPKERASDIVIKTDKRRFNYYNYYTSQKWGNVENYMLTVDSGILGIENTVQLLKQYVELYSANR